MDTLGWSMSETEALISLVELHKPASMEAWAALSFALPTGKTISECQGWIAFLRDSIVPRLAADSQTKSDIKVTEWVLKQQQKPQKRSRTQPSPPKGAAATAPSLKNLSSSEESNSEEKTKAIRPRRTADQIARLFCCPHADCEKRYGSEGALKGHIRIKHPDLFDEYQRLRVEAPLQIIVPPNAVLAVSSTQTTSSGKRKRTRGASRADIAPQADKKTDLVVGNIHLQTNSSRSDSLSSSATSSDDTLSSSSCIESPDTLKQDPSSSPTTPPMIHHISGKFSSEEPEEDDEDPWEEPPLAKRRAIDAIVLPASQQNWDDTNVLYPYSSYYGSFDMLSASTGGFLTSADGHVQNFAEPIMAYTEHHHV